MNGWAIGVEDLGKLYFADRRRSVTDLRDTVGRKMRDVFRLPTLPISRGKRAPAGETTAKPVWALRHVWLEARRGEALGILGGNGAGKTTFLRILSRIALPSEGRAYIRGRVAALLDFGAALHGELTGSENIYLYGAVLGMPKAETKRKFDAIVHFAGLERSIDAPIKRYSTGMCLRLAFGVAVHLEPEVFLVDDVLGAADAEFQQKSLEKMTALAGEGRTVVLVSHIPEHVRRLCSRGIVLERGRVVYSGSARGTADFYASAVHPGFRPESPAMEEARKEA
jgi:lipopolysaccharide transport system ATP-binding protein